MRNIEFINAGAGSGKTFFLSKKLSEVVQLKRCSAEEIILTTFTEVAAAELKNKARESLLKAGNPGQATLLASAAIGTVHSVALQLIQKYWQYLGEGVNLKVMPEADKKFFINQSLAFIPTTDELNNLDRITGSFDFQKGINEKDPDHWKGDLLDIIGKALNNRLEDLEPSRTASLQEVERLFPVNLNWELDFNLLSKILDDTLKLLKKAESNPANLKKIGIAENLINKKANLGISDLLTLQTFLSGLPKYIGKELNDIGQILQNLANINTSPLFVDGIREYINLIFDIATRSITQYRSYKQEHKLIDFNDMEVLFLRLLENEDAQNEISKRYKMVFVDEFQDCSPIQIEIFCKLSDLVEQSYWVGDPKQAIYDFRGTDPLLIEAIINHLSTGNQDNLTIGRRLSDSWRSRPQIVNLTNNIFTRALADQVDPESIALNPIRTSAELPAGDIHNPLKKWEIKDSKSNNIFFIHHLASEITNLLQQTDLTVVDKAKSKWDENPLNHSIITRAIRAEDIAVLCRTNTRVYELSAALKKFGIQVAAEQKNLTETAEMKLLLSLLNYYMDKNDTLAKATIRLLSEPNMNTRGLIDERLEFLYGADCPVKPVGQEEENNDEWSIYYERLNSWGNDNIILQKMDKIRSQSNHLSVSNLVDKLIIITGLPDLVLRWDNPLQRKNNLQAIKRMASDYENRCLVMEIASSLPGFIESVNYYGDQEITQGAAAGTDAVNVMTYHKSKGLEWPVVILTQLDYDHFSERNVYAQGYFGVNLDSTGEVDLNDPYKGKIIVLVPWPYGALNRSVPDDVKNRIILEERYIRQEKNNARELKRLLYVGMTRARDIMITVSYNSQKLKWSNDLKGITEANPIEGLNDWGTQDEILTQQFDYGDNNDYPPIGNRMVSILQKSGPAPQDSPMFRSPSKIEALESMPIELVENFNFRIQRGHTVKIEDNVVGDCLHNLFYLYKSDDENFFLPVAEKIIENYGLTGDLTHPVHVYKSAKNLYEYLSAEFGQPEIIYKELPLLMVEEGVVYKGSADMVWETADYLILVDYKTYSGEIRHVIDPENIHFAGNYSGQLAQYKKMIESSHPDQKKVKAALIYYAVLGVVIQIGL